MIDTTTVRGQRDALVQLAQDLVPTCGPDVDRTAPMVELLRRIIADIAASDIKEEHA